MALSNSTILACSTLLAAHREPAAPAALTTGHHPQTLETHWLTLVVGTHHCPGVYQYQLQWSDVSSGEQHSSLVRQGPSSEGEAVVILTMQTEVFFGAVVDQTTILTLLMTLLQAEKTLRR